ncbi:MAG: SpoIID/LytB domain-containing protein [Fusobacteriaceae bacterium]
MKGLIGIILLLFVGCSSIEKKVEKDYKGDNNNYREKRLPVREFNQGKIVPYFNLVNDVKNGKRITGSKESKYVEFYKDKEIQGNGSNSGYWRWSISFSNEDMNKMLNKNLYNLKKNSRTSVYTLKRGKWILDNLSPNPIGELKDITVVRRGHSGIVMDLLIVGTKGSFIVVKEGNIRRVLNFSADNLGKKISLKDKNGKILRNNTRMFPSGFFAIEKKGNNYNFYGGGFGHGVGMPQWTAYDLAKNEGYDYKDILMRYYNGANLEKATSVKNFKNELRVGITNNSSLLHKNIKLLSGGTITLKGSTGKAKVSSKKTVEFVKSGNNVIVKVSGKTIMTSKTPIRVSSSKDIQVLSIKRNLKKEKYPTYKGKFEVKTYGSSLLLVNVVNIEDYLKKVVASEMPISFGLEPLKAQAVAARTFAVSGFLSKKYSKYGINVDDTVNSQVYNNLDGASIVDKAVNETKGKILMYKNRPIEAYFYSTSSGYSATPREVW